MELCSKAIKNHLLSQARSDLAKRELHVESLNKCMGDIRKRKVAQTRALQEVQIEFVESRREQSQARNVKNEGSASSTS